MIGNILVFLWLLLIIVILSMIVRKCLSRVYVYPFQNYGKSDIPYIIIEIQGKQFNMIVDTGCGVSIICKSTLEQLDYTDSLRKISMHAITSDSIDSNTVTIPIKIGNTEFNSDFVITDEEDFGNYQKTLGITMHGLIGNEFLDAVDCIIDYKNHTVTMR